MSLKDKIIRAGRISRVTFVRKFIHISRKIKLPGFQGISAWEIFFFFVYSLKKGRIGMRAAAVAFHFFMAMIPFGLVLVVLTTYIPILDIEADIAPVLSGFVPEQIFDKFMTSLAEYENSSVNSWISVGFLFALYFTSNGFSVMIKAFNSSKMKFDKRKWWSARLMSLGFVFIFISGIIFMFYLIIMVRKGLVLIAESSDFVTNYFDQFYVMLLFLILSVVLYFGIAILYYLGPKERKLFKFFSPGASLASASIILISIGYVLYVNYYANYNDLYGSLGTVMILLIWIYMISFALLIGFELNASIHGALKQKTLDQLQDLENRTEGEEEE
jgi:membrane protein